MTSNTDVKKTRLRQRMIDQMRMAGLSQNTQTSYVREIKCLAEAFNMSPDRLNRSRFVPGIWQGSIGAFPRTPPMSVLPRSNSSTGTRCTNPG